MNVYVVGVWALIVIGCSHVRASKQVLKAVGNADEPSHGVLLDVLTALEKGQPFGFDYRDVSMPVHAFHGRADHMV